MNSYKKINSYEFLYKLWKIQIASGKNGNQYSYAPYLWIEYNYKF